MRIIILDTLISQISDRKIPTDVIRRLYDELYTLFHLEVRGPAAIISYLQTNADGIKMKGSLGKGQIPIFKFRISSGDRILYTYGKYLPYISNEDNSIVLLEFSSHDLQAKIARSRDYMVQHNYEYVNKIVENIKILDNEIISEEDLRATVSILLEENFKGYVYTDEELKEFSVDEIDRHIILSQEQREIKQKIIQSINSKEDKTASLVIGGAGTGKTLISVRLLDDFNNSNEESFAIYFTQSKELLKKVQKQYQGIATESTSNTIEFFNINDFCIEQLGLDYSSLFTTKEFLLFLQSSSIQAEKIKKIRNKILDVDDMMIWTEIRGILKGSMGVGNLWEHISPLNQKDFSSCISYLFEKGYLERVSIKGNKKYFKLHDSVEITREKLKSDTEYIVSNKLRNEVNKILEHFSQFDYSMRIMPKEQYLLMSNEISVLLIEQRDFIYEIALLYDEYLVENNFYDENDLVREMFANFKTNFPCYDFVIVDEVQDYTELQIFLAQKMASNRYNIVFAGDIHQIINPTVFDIIRLKSLYLNNENESMLKIYYLCKNFRCQQGIVDVANKISSLRRKVIGRKIAEVEREETSVDTTIYSVPYRLCWSEVNFIYLIEELKKYPDVVILVSTELEKKHLYSLIYEHHLDSEDLKFLKIYTISEIKGTEYAYVVCFNMIKSFNSTLQIFFSNKQIIKSKETKNRFCFNSIYVATTRAQHHLCFIDEDALADFDKIIGLKTIKSFDPEKLYFNTLNNSLETWYIEAIKLKESGKYEDALKYFLRSGEYAKKVEIYECQAEIYLSKKEYNTAILYYVMCGDLVSARKYINEKTVSQELKKYIKFIVDKVYTKDIRNIIKILTKDFEAESKEVFYNLALENMSKLLLNKNDLFFIPEV